MLTTKRKPVTVGEMLTEEFMKPLGLTQGALAEAMGVPRKHVNELCNDRRSVTAPTALILARVFGNSPEFWLNVQRRTDLWEAMNSPADAAGSNAPSRCPAPPKAPAPHPSRGNRASFRAGSWAGSAFPGPADRAGWDGTAWCAGACRPRPACGRPCADCKARRR